MNVAIKRILINLGTRKLIGLEVMQGLIYNEDDEEWQDERIYDASSGKDRNAKHG